MAPVFNDEMERRMIKAEMKRPTGGEVFFQPAPRAKDCKPVIDDMDRSQLDSIIILGAMQ